MELKTLNSYPFYWTLSNVYINETQEPSADHLLK